MEWYYANGGSREGPVSAEAFEGLIKAGTVKSDTLVWSKDMPDWKAFSEIVGDTAPCASSGGRYWRRDMAPYEGKFISAQHKEVYFQRLREGLGANAQLEYASFGSRFLAKLIDGVILWIVGMIITFGLAAVFYGTLMPRPNSANMGGFFVFEGLTMLLRLTFSLGFSWFFLSRYAATPGKMALGIKVIRSDGGPLTNGRIVGRHFAEILSSLILFIGYIMAGFDDEHRALHDRICDTRVIKSP